MSTLMDQAEDHAELGAGTQVQRPAVLGLKYSPNAGPLRMGSGCTVRSFSVLYGDIETGDNVQTGHHVLIREQTHIGSTVTIGTSTVIDGHTTIGSFVLIESRVYIPTHTTIGSYVFIGPGAILTNDRYPLRRRAEYEPVGPILEDNVTIGGGAVIVPGIRIGEGSFIAAGAVVTKDVPPWRLARGVPARIVELPEKLREGNRSRRW